MVEMADVGLWSRGGGGQRAMVVMVVDVGLLGL